MATINDLSINVCPQAYTGTNKTPYDPHLPGVIDELLKAGFEARRLWLVWDGAWKPLPYNWQGFIFSQGRMQ